MIKNIVESVVKNYLRERYFKIKETEFNRINEMFFSENINEGNSEKRNEVINLIKNNSWQENVSGEEFKTTLMKSKHPEMLTDYSVGELNNMDLYKIEGFDIGYALKDHGNKPKSEIVAVFNNEPDVSGVGEELMRSAIRNGGCYLDHFDSNKLTSLYSTMGFEEISRTGYDPEYDPNGSFKKKYGELDVVYRKHKNCK